MLKLRTAHIEDLIILGENAMDTGMDTRPEDIRKWAQKNMDYGPAFAVECDGGVVAAAGLWLIRPDIGYIWIVIDRDIDRSFAFLREALEMMRDMTEILAEQFHLKKIRAISRIGFRGSQNMLAHLGFERLRRSRKSYYIFVRRF